MTEDHRNMATKAWAFALALYAQPGVPEACLKLQDGAKVDIILLLSAVHAASQRHLLLTAADLRSMDDTVRDWRDKVVRPLRSLRRMLKTGPSPAPSEASERLRTGIKADELDAEEIENDLLAAWLTSKSPELAPLAGAAVRDIILAVVQGALGTDVGNRIAGMSHAMDLISNAAETMRPTHAS
jgi:uncharacterized protein (TIGR02444 family)